MSNFLIGNLLRFSVEFSDTDTGVPVNVGELVLTVRCLRDGGIEATRRLSLAEIDHIALGRYRCDYLPTGTGRYVYRWEATGAVVAAAESTFSVSRSRVA